MTAENPRISLIIPTVGRCKTLRWTLQTAVEQDYPHFEIIVSDNSQGPEVKNLLRDSRFSHVTCVTTSERLSMVDNWEFALSFVESGHVMIIGDDDALVINSLGKLATAITSSSPDVVQWPAHTYIWPMLTNVSYVIPPKPYRYKNLEVMNIREDLYAGLRLGICNNWKLPHLCDSAVDITLLNRIKQQTGRYFYSSCPDVYMSYMLPCMAENPVYIDTPISVVGHSLESNSANVSFGKKNNSIEQFIEENSGIESDCDHLTSLPASEKLLLDVYFKAKKHWPDECKNQEMNVPAAYAFLSALFSGPGFCTMLTQLVKTSEVDVRFFLKFVMFRLVFGLYRLKKAFGSKYDLGAFDNIYDYVKSTEKT